MFLPLVSDQTCRSWASRTPGSPLSASVTSWIEMPLGTPSMSTSKVSRTSPQAEYKTRAAMMNEATGSAHRQPKK